MFVFNDFCSCGGLHTSTQDFPKLHHLSTGDLLRQHVREQTALGRQAAAYMQAGDLVPDALMIDLLMQDATPYLEEGKSLLLDGFPRNLEQAVALESVAHIDYVVNLDIPTETIVERIADRWIHAPSGRVYSYSYKPPLKPGIDDVTGEALVQREDDKPESVRTRLAAYDKVSRLIHSFIDWLIHWLIVAVCHFGIRGAWLFLPFSILLLLFQSLLVSTNCRFLSTVL